MPARQRRKPSKRPAGLELKDLGDDPSIDRMRRAAPGATNAELLAASRLFVGAPLYGLGNMSPERAIILIRGRVAGVSPEQERLRLQAESAARGFTRSQPKSPAPPISLWDRLRNLFS